MWQRFPELVEHGTHTGRRLILSSFPTPSERIIPKQEESIVLVGRSHAPQRVTSKLTVARDKEDWKESIEFVSKITLALRVNAHQDNDRSAGRTPGIVATPKCVSDGSNEPIMIPTVSNCRKNGRFAANGHCCNTEADDMVQRRLGQRTSSGVSGTIWYDFTIGRLTQRLECLPYKEEVGGSSPSPPTIPKP